MKKGVIGAGAFVLGGVAVGLAVVLLRSTPVSPAPVDSAPAPTGEQKSVTTNMPRRRVEAVSVNTAHLRARENRRIAETNRVVQTLSDDELMDKVVKELLTALEEARNEKNTDRLLDIVAKLRRLNYGDLSRVGGSSHGGSSATKRRILEALKELGAAGLADVIDLVNDEDPSIAQSATKLIFDSLQDISLGDYNRADIVVSAAEEMTDSDSLNRLFQQFQRMRHSVGVEALTSISHTGTTEAKAKLAQAISTYTRDLSITEASQLTQWLADNPDQPQDDWFFGPIILKSQQ